MAETGIRWDSLLMRHLAHELGGRLASRRVHALRFDRERLSISLRCDGLTLAWELSPGRGDIHIARAAERLESNVPLPRPAYMSDVVVPSDERTLTFRFDVEPRAAPRIDVGAGDEPGGVGSQPRAATPTELGEARRVRTRRSDAGDETTGLAHELIVELISPVWNAVAVGADSRIIAALRPRRGGVRPLAAGRAYEPPPPTARAGATAPISLDEWRRIFRDVPLAERRRTLLARVAYTSPINATHILGGAARPDRYSAGVSAPTADAHTTASRTPRPSPPSLPPLGRGVMSGDDAHALDQAFNRYRALTAADAASPCVIVMPHGAQPYPFPLDGMPSEPQPKLLDAFDAAARARGQSPANATGTTAGTAAASATAVRALERVRWRQHRVDGRIARLRAELEGAAADAPTLRKQADLLLAQLGQVRRGARAIKLDDLAGGTVVVALDPALSPADNAQRLYDTARRRERAAQRLPTLLREAEAEAKRLNELAERIQAGTAESTELESFAPSRERGRQRPVAPRLPYRRYRTSGGLEVRVGRSAGDSDELTLHLSSPDDVWLHAREVAGAHVVLRWTDRDANPPGADLREAAILAAVHSKARSSATVPVDWTRRKYVRKPRRAPPGRVTIERAKTLFVEPSESLERRLREFSE